VCGEVTPDGVPVLVARGGLVDVLTATAAVVGSIALGGPRDSLSPESIVVASRDADRHHQPRRRHAEPDG